MSGKVKAKTKKSAAKRYRITKNGKVLYNNMGKRHLLTKKSAKSKRNKGRKSTLSAAEAKRAIQLLPSR